MYDDSVIAEAADRITTAAPGAQVSLFGSHARGEAHENSDLDLLVVEPVVDDAAGEEVRLRRALVGQRLFVDVVVVIEADARRLRGVRSSVVGAALAEGRVLVA
ncbi:MAG TPA: nucleotidyltransferase domain-containing protein [Solirubrobacteraceae bacterium]|nr:nucleotidyltransferase domain-containing protein [Solirubrobacteraceae bacterium]